MIALLSPAKTLDYKRPFPDIEATTARLGARARTIAKAAALLDESDLRRLMHISPALAALNVERFRHFGRQPERPALYAFAGDVYTGFEARSLDPVAIRFAQDHVRILSGLYGLLRPLDAIRPYRLEMGTRWAPDAATLYDHWGDRIADLLVRDAKAEGSRAIVNLASKEYWAAVEKRLPPGLPVHTIEFLQAGPGGARFESFAAKRARGMMARYLCEHALQDVDALKGFDSDGYAFDAAGSDERRWRFVRRRE